MSLNGELHWEFLQYLFGIAVDDKSYGLFCWDASLVAVEQLVFRNLRSRRLMFKDGSIVVHIHIREGVRTTVRAQQQRVAR